MRLARLTLVAALLLGACNGGDGDDDDTLPPPVSTTVDYSVPQVIDVAYVEKVMEALDHVYGDAIRILAREREITKDFLEHLAAIYTPSEFELTQEIWVRDVAAGLPGLRDDPGNPRTEIQRLLRAETECVVAAVARDFSPTRTTSDRSTPQRFIALVPKTGTGARSMNLTPWLITFDGFKDDGSEPSQPCV